MLGFDGLAGAKTGGEENKYIGGGRSGENITRGRGDWLCQFEGRLE